MWFKVEIRAKSEMIMQTESKNLFQLNLWIARHIYFNLFFIFIFGFCFSNIKNEIKRNEKAIIWSYLSFGPSWDPADSCCCPIGWMPSPKTDRRCSFSIQLWSICVNWAVRPHICSVRCSLRDNVRDSWPSCRHRSPVSSWPSPNRVSCSKYSVWLGCPVAT